MEILQKIGEWGLQIISVFLLLFVAFGFLLARELNNYCKREVDRDEYEKRKRRNSDN